MEAVAAAVGQAPVMRDFRRNVASTVIILTLGTLLIAGGVDWSYRGISNWAYNKANTNISLPLTSWQLEVRMRWVKAAASLDAAAKGPASIHEYFDAHPLRTKLYSVGLMCSPRWALLWAWLFDREPGLLLLHQHVAQHQANVMYYVRRAMQYIMPGFLPLSPTEAAADSAPIMQLLHKIFQLNSTLLFWVAWLLCPGLQSAYYTLFFTSQAPIKTLYGVLIGLTRTAVECRALFKCTQAAMKHDQQLVRNSLLCCYALPFIMTLQSMSALLVLGLVFPHWILHICVVAFCVWGPPAMIALMTTAWQPDRHRPLLVDAPMGVVDGAPAGGAVDAMAAFIANNNNIRGQAGPGKASEDAVYWPKPLVVPEAVEEQCSIPHYFICSITHSIMLEPAVTVTGATYERGAIMEWLRTQKRDPLTGRELRPEQVSPNLALYRAIDEWIHANQEQLKRHKHHHEQQQQHSHHHRHAAGHHSNQSGHSDKSSSAAAHNKCEKGRRRQSLGSRRGSMEAGASSSPAAVVEEVLAGQE